MQRKLTHWESNPISLNSGRRRVKDISELSLLPCAMKITTLGMQKYSGWKMQACPACGAQVLRVC